ncbi:S41 family peptidase [Eubacterium oxidoreducens]|uniref:Carboxyl-terminal processing protease n=1 Tax=Eubacterium oxidoreducens TaxID=1732 RepID=A0A1G6CD93_EUBOX|nr:S41 family peptidase [Eubacterium oxidoreducens]SDB30847.1 carboxyl-terminal processing protease [Eubacterium oxidoreducens]
MFGKKENTNKIEEAKEETQPVELPMEEAQPDAEELAIREMVGRSMKKIGFAQGIMLGVVIAIAASMVTGLLVMKTGNLGPFQLAEAGTTSEEDSDSSSDSSILDTATQQKLEVLYKYLNQYYYEDLDVDDLQEGLFAGLLEGAGDTYTRYYTAEEYEELQESTSGTFYGIGALLYQDETTKQVIIDKIYDGSGAQEAGLEVGDVIKSADGYKATSMELSDFVQHVRGEEGSMVELVISRDGEEMTLEVERKEVEEVSVTSQMLTDEIALITISEFTEVTTEQYEEEIASVKEQGAKAVIFDVRSNPGGTVSSVTEILDDILPEGTVVYTEDKDGERTDYTSDAENYLDMPMAVLVNGSSASAAEIFAGAIRDFDYGTLIGTTTYGKGIVQTILPFTDGSAIKLTTATYYTPSGECIHEKGITPDVELEYEYTGSDEEYEYTKDNQVAKAIKVLKKELAQ